MLAAAFEQGGGAAEVLWFGPDPLASVAELAARHGDRDQPSLLPPDLRDWLPNDHLAWFILDVIDQLDLEPFLRTYRADGHGHPADDPKTLLGVLLYAYAVGVRSSRQIERRCQEDVAFRVLAGNQLPDLPRRVPGRVVEAVRGGRAGPPGRGRAGRHQSGGQRRRSG